LGKSPDYHGPVPSPAKPSLDLVRTLTDDTVLGLLMEHRRMTRADIAARSGISKTTISESMRRLEAAGVVVDTGERTTGRGRSGSYYTIAEGRGSALCVSITPGGIIAEVVDPGGVVRSRVEAPLARDAGPKEAAKAVRTACARAAQSADGVVLAAVVSAADPVDRRTGRLVQLPDAPFLVGDLDPVAIVAPHVAGDVVVDNDVNWAARAEGRRGAASEVDDFVYLYLGEGLGCAVVSDAEVRRGHGGLAGEIAHVIVPGADGRAVPFTQVFGQLGLRRPRSTAIDVTKLLKRIDDSRGEGARTTLAEAVGAVLLAATSFSDPQVLVVGGPWGRAPTFVEALRARGAGWPRPVPVVPAALEEEADLVGARDHAVDLLRSAIMRAAQGTDQSSR
jgi:predicted NBD/HSP70 family sugar kinase/biotin operon repressor